MSLAQDFAYVMVEDNNTDGNLAQVHSLSEPYLRSSLLSLLIHLDMLSLYFVSTWRAIMMEETLANLI